jgi:hypothetical protein
MVLRQRAVKPSGPQPVGKFVDTLATCPNVAWQKDSPAKACAPALDGDVRVVVALDQPELEPLGYEAAVITTIGLGAAEHRTKAPMHEPVSILVREREDDAPLVSPPTGERAAELSLLRDRHPNPERAERHQRKQTEQQLCHSRSLASRMAAAAGCEPGPA